MLGVGRLRLRGSRNWELRHEPATYLGIFAIAEKASGGNFRKHFVKKGKGNSLGMVRRRHRNRPDYQQLMCAPGAPGAVLAITVLDRIK